MELLKQVSDPRHQSYITYDNHVLMMTRILSAIFYINSMRKTSAEFNCETVIANIGHICGEQLEEIPYWETINYYLEQIDPQELQDTVCELVRHLLRSRAFEHSRIRDQYWHILLSSLEKAIKPFFSKIWRFPLCNLTVYETNVWIFQKSLAMFSLIVYNDHTESSQCPHPTHFIKKRRHTNMKKGFLILLAFCATLTVTVWAASAEGVPTAGMAMPFS